MSENNYYLENTESFDAILIKSNMLDQEEHDWANADYMETLFNTEYCSIIKMSADPKQFLADIAINLENDIYEEPYITPHIIGFDKNHTYELIYNTFTPGKENLENIKYNYIASVIDMQGENIFGNAILLKLTTPHTDFTSKYSSISKKDIVSFLNTRVHTKVVIYEDDMFREEEISGDTDYFAKIFFEEDESMLVKVELPFLKHNINIWYVKDEYGEADVFGKLINEKHKVFKGVIFTNVTINQRGNITVDEVKKIIYLSHKLENYTLAENLQLVNAEDDINNKKIIKNKYRILEKIYNDEKEKE